MACLLEFGEHRHSIKVQAGWSWQRKRPEFPVKGTPPRAEQVGLSPDKARIDLVGLEWGLRSCVSKKLTPVAGAASLDHTLNIKNIDH